jgi:hypothetical protein
LAERVGGEFGSGAGEEFTDSDPNNPDEGVYIPMWMPIDELPRHEKVFPEELAKLVLKSSVAGWLSTGFHKTVPSFVSSF